ncbi:hypothetical protein NM688_g8729 [Phlebia brevispora]|uniref:Uncharacterized protein n=1 Tax=Phlebia brevispora TaxID=194682 RepID=A0ACC1RS47_9APHY|nr:hypothetical protein NM688_g8729 [Phlebia brevispora]
MLTFQKNRKVMSSNSEDDVSSENNDDDNLFDTLLEELNEDASNEDTSLVEEELDVDYEAADHDTIEDVITEVNAEDTLSIEEKCLGHFMVSKIFQNLPNAFFIHLPFALTCHPYRQINAIREVLELQPALDHLLAQTKHDKSGKKGLHYYKLFEEK